MLDTSHFTHIYINRLLFGMLVPLISHVTMTDPLPNSTAAPSNLRMDLKLIMNFSHETTVHDKDIWRYYELPWISSIEFNDHLFLISQLL